MARARTPLAFALSAAASAASRSVTEFTNTSVPFSANRSTAARPIPREPPVIRTTLPVSPGRSLRNLKLFPSLYDRLLACRGSLAGLDRLLARRRSFCSTRQANSLSYVIVDALLSLCYERLEYSLRQLIFFPPEFRVALNCDHKSIPSRIFNGFNQTIRRPRNRYQVLSEVGNCLMMVTIHHCLFSCGNVT